MLYLHRNLAGLAKITGNGNGRHALQSVHVFVDGGYYRAEATDGKRLAIVRGQVGELPCEQGEEVLVGAKDWEEACKLGRNEPKEAPLVIEQAPAGLLVRVGGKTMQIPEGEGRFPKVDEIKPGLAPLGTVDVDPDKLIDLLRLASSIQPENKRVTLAMFGHDRPMGIVARGGQDGEQAFDALLMPLS